MRGLYYGDWVVWDKMTGSVGLVVTIIDVGWLLYSCIIIAMTNYMCTVCCSFIETISV